MCHLDFAKSPVHFVLLVPLFFFLMCCTVSLLEVVLKKSKWHICEIGSLQTGAAVPFGRGTDAGEKKQKKKPL